MKKAIGWGISAALGIALGVGLFANLMITEVEGSGMLPALAPGDRVLIDRLAPGEQVEVGDIVVYEAPYYSIDGEGQLLFLRVTGERGDWLKVDWEAPTTMDKETIGRTRKAAGQGDPGLS